MTLGLVSIATPDLPRLQAFYQDLLGTEPVAVIPEIYVEFQLSGLRLGLYRSHHPDFVAQPGAISICLQVKSLEAFLQNPSLPGLQLSSERHAEHGKEVDCRDPDGNRIVIHEPSPQFWLWLQQAGEC
jgi:catechol 2,3-dioxygenase-like lactoylglutathione lyase family enzyme